MARRDADDEPLRELGVRWWSPEDDRQKGLVDGRRYQRSWHETMRTIHTDMEDARQQLRERLAARLAELPERGQLLERRKADAERALAGLAGLDENRLEVEVRDARRRLRVLLAELLLFAAVEMVVTGPMIASVLGLAPVAGYLLALVFTVGFGGFWQAAVTAASLAWRVTWGVICVVFAGAMVAGSWERAYDVTAAFPDLPFMVVFPMLAIVSVGVGLAFGQAMLNRGREATRRDAARIELDRLHSLRAERRRADDELTQVTADLQRLTSLRATLDDKIDALRESRRHHYNDGFSRGFEDALRRWQRHEWRRQTWVGRLLMLRPWPEPVDERPDAWSRSLSGTPEEVA